MKWFDCLKANLVFVVAIAVCAIGSGPAVADFTFGKATNLGPMVNSTSDDYEAVMSPDGLELYFCSNRPGGYGSYDVWVTKRPSIEEPWGPPANLGPQINTSDWDSPGSITADGLTLSLQLGSMMATVTRATVDAPWGQPVNLPPAINSGWNGQVIISADGLEVFLGSKRSGGSGQGDIWVSTRATISDLWGPPVNLGPIVNTAAEDVPTWISPDGLTLFLFSTRSGGYGAVDTWMTTRAARGSAWTLPTNLGPSINTSYPEYITAISPDGRLCYFGDFGLTAWGPRPGGLGGSDLYQASITPVVDFNNDGKVDIKDLVRMIESWGKNDPSVDIGPYVWGDGKVDANDLKVLMRYWGQEVEVYDPTLIVHWAFDASEGSVAEDDSLSGLNDATLKGNPVWQPADGKVDGAIQLDGVDDYIQTPIVLNPSKGEFSVFAWVKGGAPGQVILSQMNKANWLSTDATGGWLMTELKAQGSLGTTLQSQSVVTDGNWHRVGLVWDGTNRLLYVDDMEVARDTQPSLPDSSIGLFIGVGNKRSKGTFWSGLIDDVRIYNQAVKP